MYAILSIKGQQCKVVEGSKVRVDLMNVDKGKELLLKDVVLFNDGKNVEMGTPFLNDKKIKVRVTNHIKDKKIIVFKKKRRKGYKRKNGHRQRYTELEILKIT